MSLKCLSNCFIKGKDLPKMKYVLNERPLKPDKENRLIVYYNFFNHVN